MLVGVFPGYTAILFTMLLSGKAWSNLQGKQTGAWQANLENTLQQLDGVIVLKSLFILHNY